MSSSSARRSRIISSISRGNVEGMRVTSTIQVVCPFVYLERMDDSSTYASNDQKLCKSVLELLPGPGTSTKNIPKDLTIWHIKKLQV